MLQFIQKITITVFAVGLLVLSSGNHCDAEPGDIFIEFMARPTAPITDSSVGHVFFCISLNLSSGIKEECFGFYPKSDLKAFDGPGVVSNEFQRPAIQNVSTSLVHKIDESTRSAIYAEIRKWAGTDYKLLINNCMDFSLAIATAAGLKTNRQAATIPTEFVDGMKKLYWSLSWGSRDPNTRFRLVINGQNVEWTEVHPESHQTIKANVTLKTSADGSSLIERPNSADVLQGSGYNVSIISSIIAANPRPSFMKLRRQGRTISAEWNGLIVLKDNAGRFSGLKQPGSNPSKHFDFDRLQ